MIKVFKLILVIINNFFKLEILMDRVLIIEDSQMLCRIMRDLLDKFTAILHKYSRKMAA